MFTISCAKKQTNHNDYFVINSITINNNNNNNNNREVLRAPVLRQAGDKRGIPAADCHPWHQRSVAATCRLRCCFILRSLTLSPVSPTIKI